ncbi:hypothetical protein BE20_16640 [Sorangium cellulosum]|uniref:Lipase n=1 Tax=Sorangium cellulosum TaxID=56 RepID=A0A150SF01_SORCE|nr:hypothetical protein BE20_16640 [Sorangium cellulosum]KYF98903.1 hypothetical protein BE18_30630 [Sorangium cellulosum]
MERQDDVSESDKLTLVMLTLSGLASTCCEPLPNEILAEEQKDRIEQGLAARLANPRLLTACEWELHKVFLSMDKAYLAYIAKHTGTHEIAVVFRGTVFSNDTNVKNDNKVGILKPFLEDEEKYGRVAEGFYEAFNEIKDGTELESELRKIVNKDTIIYVAGHSLGGALTTMFSLYLRDKLESLGSMQVYTFAAPGVGDQKFAELFDQQKPAPICVWNAYDVVPNSFAHDTLLTVQDKFYPPPGPTPTADDQKLVKTMMFLAGRKYTQTKQQPALNLHPPYTVRAPDGATWQDEMAFQHQVNTYLRLLNQSGDQLLPEKPVVNVLKPIQARAGDTVTITGQNFTPDCTVNFYIMNKPVPASNVVVQGTDSITFQVPPGHGAVDLRVIRRDGLVLLEASAKLKDENQFRY